MKLKTVLLSLFVFLTIVLQINAKSLDLTYETFSIGTNLKSPKYKKLDTFDSGHHKTILRIENLPHDSIYVLKLERPLLTKKHFEYEYPKEALEKNAKGIREKNSVLFISSLGFMPGEKILAVLETKDGKPISKKISFIPNPIIKKISHGNAKIRAELILMSPTTYELSFEELPTYENLRFHSFSSGEKIDQELFFKRDSVIVYSPGVIGKKGGFSELSITRKNGEQFNLTLPWGEELEKHLDGKGKFIASDFTLIKK